MASHLKEAAATRVSLAGTSEHRRFSASTILSKNSKRPGERHGKQHAKATVLLSDATSLAGPQMQTACDAGGRRG